MRHSLSIPVSSAPRRTHYDVVVAGARVAGAATAMLMARQGLRVLVVDPMRRGSDTLSTHALMRGGVLQLHRWGVLDDIRAAGTPAIKSTTFHYGDDDAITVPIKARDGVDALYAPRRTVIDRILLDAAEAARAEIALGYSVTDLLWDADGRVRGVRIADGQQREIDVATSMVVGADGLNSRVARRAGAEIEEVGRNATACIYGYVKGLGLEGFNWFYNLGGSVGTIPSNNDETCVFVSLPPSRFDDERKRGLEAIFGEVLRDVSPKLAEMVAGSERSGKLRAFAGMRGFIRRSAGRGWALVGDAGYFKDPLTAHGMTDALRDAELLARAVAMGGDAALAVYQSIRDDLVMELFNVTDRIASFDWTLDELKAYHLTLSKEMNAEVDLVRALGDAGVTWQLSAVG